MAEDSGFTQIPYELNPSDVSKLKFDPGLNASKKPFTDIQYQVQDSASALSDDVTLTVNVEPINDTPVVTPDSFEVVLDESAGDGEEDRPDGLISASGSLLLRDVDVDDQLSIRVSNLTIGDGTYSLALPTSLTSDNNKALLDMLRFRETPSSDTSSASLSSLDADEPHGSTVYWEFLAGTSGDSAFDFLAKGETLQLIYSLEVSDSASPSASASSEIKITIVGTNDTPIVQSGVDSAALVENSGTTLSAGGRITFSDVDLTDNHNVSVISVDILSESSLSPPANLLNSLRDYADSFVLTLADDSNSSSSHLDWSFTLPDVLVDYLGADNEGNPEHLVVTYTVAITDDSSADASDSSSEIDTQYLNVLISIEGHEDQLVLADVTPIKVFEIDQSTTRNEQGLNGLLQATDPDSPPLVFGIDGHSEQSSDGTLVQSGKYGDLYLEVNTGAYRYDYDQADVESLDAGESRSEEFLLTATSSDNQVVTKTLTVDLYGADDAPVLGVVESGLIAEVSKSSEVTQSGLSGELSASDVDGDDLIFSFKSTLTSSIDTSGMAWGVALSPDGSTAFVADSESGMQVIDISDPLSPSLIATTPTLGYVSDVTLSPDGTIAFLTDGYGLEIVDVSNAVKPTSIHRLETSGYSTSVTLSSDGSSAFVASGSSGVEIIDVSNPSNPVLLTSLSTSADATNVTLSSDGDTAFVRCFSTSSGIQSLLAI